MGTTAGIFRSANATPGIAVSGVNFGWGSAGKLSAILGACVDLCPELRIVVAGTALGRPVLVEQRIEAWYEEWPDDVTEAADLLDRHGITAALVVLDPQMAMSLEMAKCPTVFVDSLPYLWTAADPLPFDVTAYCAQICPVLPLPSWEPLRRIARLHWVESIAVSPPARQRDRRHAVLNLGGLHSPSNPTGNPTYLELVLLPALSALARSGYQTVDVCGNIQVADLPPGISELGITVRIGRHPHANFIALLASAGLIMTSPGLTTLLEASASGAPTVCLPPQNLSQILNGQRFALTADPACHIAWPTDVLDLELIDSARVAGEEAGLEAMALALAAQDPALVRPRLQQAIEDAIKSAARSDSWSALADDAGLGGARQVAEILLDVATRGRAVPGLTEKGARLSVAALDRDRTRSP